MPSTICLLTTTLLLSSVLACERVSERYGDAASARRAGIFERGWLPDVLPSNAGPIVAVHDLDTNARCSRSEFPPAAKTEVHSRLLELGFHRLDGSLPGLPFKACPFTLEMAHGTGVILVRPGAREIEIAAIDTAGILLFWTADPDQTGD